MGATGAGPELHSVHIGAGADMGDELGIERLASLLRVAVVVDHQHPVETALLRDQGGGHRHFSNSDTRFGAICTFSTARDSAPGRARAPRRGHASFGQTKKGCL